MFVCLGTCIGKFLKHRIDVFIQCFHIRVMFVSNGIHGYGVILNVSRSDFDS